MQKLRDELDSREERDKYIDEELKKLNKLHDTIHELKEQIEEKEHLNKQVLLATPS